MWGPIPSHSLAFSGACGMTLGLPFWPATLQPLALVASPRLGLRQARCKCNAKFCYAFYGFVNGNFWLFKTRKYLAIKVVSIVFTWQSSITCFGSSFETYSILHDKTSLHIFDNFITLFKHRRLSFDRTFNVSNFFTTCINIDALEIFMALSFVQTLVTFGLSFF